jgi:hypothetical protein
MFNVDCFARPVLYYITFSITSQVSRLFFSNEDCMRVMVSVIEIALSECCFCEQPHVDNSLV